MPVMRAGAPEGRAWLTYAILVLAFALMGLYAFRPAASVEVSAVGASAAATASLVQEGRRTKQAAVLLLGGLAVLTLSDVRRRRRLAALQDACWPTHPDGLPPAPIGQMSPGVARALRLTTANDGATQSSPVLLSLLILYLALACISVTWAGDVALAAKRALVFLVLAFAAYVLAQAWSLRELVYFSIVATTTSLLLGIGGALARGEFHPFARDYRFVGFANPNLHGMEAACLVIASGVAVLVNRRRRILLTGLLLFGLVMLVLTKSRTALGALILAAAVAGFLVVKRNRIPILLVGTGALVFTIAVFLPSMVAHAHNAALLGRDAANADPATLSGRTLLWKDLLYFVAARPLFGYGFDSFWTPDHIAEISIRRGWVIAQAHSGYFETLLSLGWIGASLLVLGLISGLVAAIRRFRRLRAPLALFAVGMLVWYLVNMVAEAVPEAHFSTLIVMVILAHLALRTAAPDDVHAALGPDVTPWLEPRGLDNTACVTG